MTVQKNIAGTKYVPNGLQTMRGQASNTATEQIRNPARQHQSRDVKVGDNPRAQTLSFGKEIEEHAIQQGSVRVNNRMQQGIGELAAHSCPLERKGKQGHRSEGSNVFSQRPMTARPETTELQYNTSNGLNSTEYNQSLAIFPGNLDPDSVKRVLKPVEFCLQLTPWEGILVDVLNNRSQMSQVSGILVAVVIQPPKPQEFCLTTGILVAPQVRHRTKESKQLL
ncbi:hypothetical protein R3P38DRAFT_2776462 [Favolaschia claudopus]|uniref:Uncharacterized protein n=1 Tax=Favolaschia claudopus TaxID=2862362 RepID=A0AAW0BP20_9AGAR